MLLAEGITSVYACPGYSADTQQTPSEADDQENSPNRWYMLTDVA